MKVDPRLYEFATKDQTRNLKALEEHGGSVSKAARSIGINQRTLSRSISRVKRAAARAGYAPDYDMTRPAPAGFSVSGVSTLYGPDGQLRAQWVKTKQEEEERLQALAESIERLADDVRGIIRPTKAPKKCAEDMLTVYPMGDPHIGMYAWAAECGEDFDCDIASTNLRTAVSRLVDASPPASTCLVANLGDYFHADNYRNMTEQSGNVLDIDTRWPRVLDIGVSTFRDAIMIALERHQIVEVDCRPGNHDRHSARMLTICLAAMFESEPRVRVNRGASPFFYREFGLNLLGFAHGDTVRMQDLGGIMAADQSDAWGRTRFRYWLTGHIHHKSRIELPGCIVESFRTLAAKDAWHTSYGYRAGRDMEAITYGLLDGELERHRIDVTRLGTKKRGG